MKPFDVSAIAEAACKLAIASGQANALEVVKIGVDQAVDGALKQVTNNLAPRNINLHVSHKAGEEAEDAFRTSIRDKILLTVATVEAALRDAALPLRIQGQIGRAKEDSIHEAFNPAVISALFREISCGLVAELTEPIFLYIAPGRRAFYEQSEPPFGELVVKTFPEAERDIAAAGRCYAIEQWTACVSHLMRALEAPLQLFAKRVGVSFPAPTDLENWKTIVDNMAARIEAEVKRLEGTTKSHARNAELQFLGDVALDFRHFKNAWRNNVAHGRDWYDEREALRVYDAVKHFMQKMAEASQCAL